MIKSGCKRAQINKNITPHSLRRTYATNLNDQKVNPYSIKKLLGHDSLKTTFRYI